MATKEPSPLTGEIRFEEADFHALSERLAGDPEATPRRLVTRRKLLALGKRAVAELKADGYAFESRTSLHHPHAFNGNRVRRIWTYLTRPKAEKRSLKKVLGPDLGKDLDAAFRNAHLALAIEAEALEVSLRIHPDGWYDGQNLKNKVERTEMGFDAWRDELNRLDGFFLRMDDWKGEWRCGELTRERLEEFLSYYTPGDHRLSVERRWPVPAAARDAALGEEVPGTLVGELRRLGPLYRCTAWSPENDHLFSS
ncbi:MAG TPA: hypothetical protein ENJ09_11945 [Planctomycetes bacterium]|nr:hypothetical protein [Planctomycetota bacterium]